MYNITLVASMHGERGKCNSDELYKIFESLEPNVVFEEMPSSLLERAYQEIPVDNDILELKCIRKYLLGHKIIQIPVDIELDQSLFTRRVDNMLNTFKKYHVYNKIENELKDMVEKNGFAFLNSERCMKMFEEKKIIEKNILAFSGGNNLLLGTYKLFYEEHEKRENAWIRNIYKYCEQHFFKNAIFTFGVAHRRSILNKIKEYEKKEKIKLNWVNYHG